MNDCCYVVGNDDCSEDRGRDYDALVVGNDVLDLGSFVGGEFRLRISLNKRCILLVQS